MLVNERGVSLVQVVVALIIIIIITSFAIWYASNTSTEAKLARIYTEITSVKEGYENFRILNEIDPDSYSLDDLLVSKSTITSNSEYSTEDIEFLNSISDATELYFVDEDNAKKLEIQSSEKIKMEYIIDGKTGNIYLIGGFARPNATDDEIVYEYKDIVALYNSTLK